MADHPSRLGRGLGALLAPRPISVGEDPDPLSEVSSDRPTAEPELREDGGALAAVEGVQYREVPLSALRANPRQPRTVFDEDALAELAASITQVGLLQPIVVRQVDVDQYEIVMGERRWRAADAAGLTTVPVLVRDTPPDALLRDALLENLHRADLNPLDEAAAYAQLLADFGATHEQLAGRLGRSRAHVSNTIRLLHLPPAVQRRLAAGVLSAGHARAILGVPDGDAQERLAARVSAEGLSVRALEEIVAVGSDDTPSRRERRGRAAPRELTELAEALTDRWETRVRVTAGRTRGRLVVEFGSVADLDRILAVMAPDVAPDLRATLRGGEPGDTAATAHISRENGQSG
jgi:ParB family chromosome partitioning protein